MFRVERFSISDNCWVLYSTPANKSTVDTHVEIVEQVRGEEVRVIEEGKIIYRS